MRTSNSKWSATTTKSYRLKQKCQGILKSQDCFLAKRGCSHLYSPALKDMHLLHITCSYLLRHYVLTCKEKKTDWKTLWMKHTWWVCEPHKLHLKLPSLSSLMVGVTLPLCASWTEVPWKADVIAPSHLQHSSTDQRILPAFGPAVSKYCTSIKKIFHLAQLSIILNFKTTAVSRPFNTSSVFIPVH